MMANNLKKDTLKQLRADMEQRFATLEHKQKNMDQALSLVVGPMVDPVFPIRAYSPGDVRADGATMLPDHTWQFPNAPTGSTGATGAATTPALPPEYKIGTRLRWQHREWFLSEKGDGIFRMISVDSPDVSPWLYPRDVELVTAAK